MSHWLYLSIAIVAEVIGTSFLNSSQGFTRLVPSIVVIVGYGVAFYFLSLVLRPGVSRRANVAAGVVYALTIIASAIGEGSAYLFFLTVVEVALVLLISWLAWNWPRR